MEFSNSSSSSVQGVSWGAKNALRGDVKEFSNGSSSLIQGVSWGAKNALRGDVKEFVQVYNRDMSPILVRCHLGNIDDLVCDAGIDWDVALDLLIRHATIAGNRFLASIATSVKTSSILTGRVKEELEQRLLQAAGRSVERTAMDI
eukprot:GHVH01015235.1.p3 GENE.GHVH01015235.1~~GHVH01015235.1.p3  ORF type:complete len:146 (+),score=15.37 GHVH01015235.1:147-584(+)